MSNQYGCSHKKGAYIKCPIFDIHGLKLNNILINYLCYIILKYSINSYII